MAECPNCDKEISFFVAWRRGFIGPSEAAESYIVCKQCGKFSRLTKKSSSIYTNGVLLTIIGGFGLSSVIKDVLFMYGIFIWFLIGWPYIFWKKFAIVELEEEKNVIRYKNQRIWCLFLLFVFLVMIIFLFGTPRQNIQEIQSFLKIIIDSFKK